MGKEGRLGKVRSVPARRVLGQAGTLPGWYSAWLGVLSFAGNQPSRCPVCRYSTQSVTDQASTQPEGRYLARPVPTRLVLGETGTQLGRYPAKLVANQADT